jgi:hypothetical protein
MSQLEAFTLTILIEVTVAVSLAATLLPAAISSPAARGWARFVGAVIFASCLTHPVLWAIAKTVPRDLWWPAICAMEVVIGVVEGVVVGTVGGAGLRRGLVVGVSMNAVSFGVGVILAASWSDVG